MRRTILAGTLACATMTLVSGCETSRATAVNQTPEGSTASTASQRSADAVETSPDDPALAFMAEMDSIPPEQRVPGWENVRAMMTRQPPRVGEAAPSFELETREGNGSINLAEFGKNRPVVLIFGSWT